MATLVTVWPISGKRTSLIQRATRWLSNRYLNQHTYYMPLVKHILDNWEGVEIALSMDRTDIKNRLSILVVGVCYKKRVIPLGWRVLAFGSTSAQMQIQLLESIRHLLPDAKKVRVTLFADCEFRAVELQEYCRKNKAQRRFEG